MKLSQGEGGQSKPMDVANFSSSSSSSSLPPPITNDSSVQSHPLPFLPPPDQLTTDQVDLLLETTFNSSVGATSDNRLSGRSVMIPMGNQAFRIGHLKPKLDENQNELVEIRVPDDDNDASSSIREKKYKTIQVSTTTAKKWLLRSSSKKQQTTKSPPPSSTDTTTATTTSTSSNNTIKNKRTKNSTKTGSTQPSFSNSNAVVAPFMNIQEEYDSTGKLIDGSVYDVTRRLQEVWKHTGEEKDGSDGLYQQQTKQQTEYEDNADEKEQQDAQKNNMVSTQDYEAISKRLDELARLEEEAEASAAAAAAKATKVPAGKKKKQQQKAEGWNKGFLNAKKSIKNNKIQKSPATTKSTTLTSPPASKQLPTSPSISSSSEKQTPPSTFQPAKQPKQGGVVIDTDRNSIQEIPRIGTQKVPPKNTPRPSSSIESTSMFSSIIQERPSNGGIAERKLQPKTTTTMSRFAQERQQQRVRQQQQQQGQQTSKPMSRFKKERQQQR